MAYYNPLKSSIQNFAKAAMEHGWTEEEVMEVAKAVRDEINQEIAHGHACRMASILEKHARPVIERKKKEQKIKED